ncbi:MAG: translational GTPase TypA [Leptospirales bacterium]|nr:translational GTPase TypA [Leptospirales bacterium]
MQIRNVAIIAHVDHGKTTLVDGLLSQTESIKEKERTERVMDSMDLERERGITIKAKNASLFFKETKINIIDTPGHADFGGEVERVLSMADCSLLLVDAFDGPMPQTRFVLDKSLRLGHRPILVVNKIDRDGANADLAVEKVFDLFDDLGATAEQHDFPVIYCSARLGFASRDLARCGKEDRDLSPLLDLILEHVPPVDLDPGEPLQFQVMNLDYDDYVGRLGIGRIFRGAIRSGMNVTRMSGGKNETFRVSKLYGYNGIRRAETQEAIVGDIVAVAGAEDLSIGDTICDPQKLEARAPIVVDEPTVSMYFLVNDSPFAGREGQFVTTRQLRDRLYRETLTNVALRVKDDPERPDRFQVQGRGDLHLSVLVETMRREGYELQVSRPEVILKRQDGKTLEPFEIVVIDLPEDYSGIVINELNRRRGDMQGMDTSVHGTVRLEYHAPTRAMIGFRNFLISESRGTAAMTSRFLKYADYAGEIPGRKNGALISMENGSAVPYALWGIQERGTLFVEPGELIYPGMVIGECARDSDMEVNPCKEKKLTNVRASGSDEAVRLTPPRKMGLEKSIEFIDDDELVEVTPQSIRIRKKFLDATERKRQSRKKLVESVS